MRILKNFTSKVDFKHPHECDDSIGRRCLYDISEQECVARCAAEDQCKYGFYTNKTCYNIASKYDEQHPIGLVKPGRDSTFFYKEDQYDEKDEYKNNAYYFDYVQITSGGGRTLFDGAIFQIWKPSIILNEKLSYGDECSFRLSESNALLSLLENGCSLFKSHFGLDTININVHSLYQIHSEQTFQIMSLTKCPGTDVEYSDMFYIVSNHQILYVDAAGQLKHTYRNVQYMIEKKIDFLFSFIPMFDVYYCEGKKCVPIRARLAQGKKTYRNSNCSFEC